MIHGPPGTGKTITLVALIEQLVAKNQRVLVSAMSNTAVDNLLEKMANVDSLKNKLVRVGHPVRV